MKAQTSFEYVLIVLAAIVLLSVVLFLARNAFQSTGGEVNAEQQEYSDLLASLKAPPTNPPAVTHPTITSFSAIPSPLPTSKYVEYSVGWAVAAGDTVSALVICETNALTLTPPYECVAPVISCSFSPPSNNPEQCTEGPLADGSYERYAFVCGASECSPGEKRSFTITSLPSTSPEVILFYADHNPALPNQPLIYSITWSAAVGNAISAKVCSKPLLADCEAPPICSVNSPAPNPATPCHETAPAIEGVYDRYAFVCNQYGACSEGKYLQLTVAVVPSTNTPPTVTQVLANSENPTNVYPGGELEFSVWWADPGDQVTTMICETNAPCAGSEICTTGLSGTSPSVCPVVNAPTTPGVYKYYAFACDDENACSTEIKTVDVSVLPFTTYYAPSTAKLVLTSLGAPRNSSGDLRIDSTTEWAASSRTLSLAKNEKRAVQLVISATEEFDEVWFDAPTTTGVIVKAYYEQGVVLQGLSGICGNNSYVLPAGTPGGDLVGAGETWFDALIPLDWGEKFSMAAGEFRPIWFSITATDNTPSTLEIAYHTKNSLGVTNASNTLLILKRVFSLPSRPSLYAFFQITQSYYLPVGGKPAYFEAISQGISNHISTEVYADLATIYAPENTAKMSFGILPINRLTDWVGNQITPTAFSNAKTFLDAYDPSGQITWAVYVWDEPVPENYSAVQARGQDVHVKFSAYPNVKSLVTEQINEYKAGGYNMTAIDYFDPLAAIFFSKPDEYGTSRPFVYNVDTRTNGGGAPINLKFGTSIIDFAASRHRAVPWVAKKYDFAGIQYWAANIFALNASTTAWGTPRLYTKKMRDSGQCTWDSGNGWAYLYYPGGDSFPPEVQSKFAAPINSKYVVPSIRLELWGEGMEDYEYLTCAKNKGADIAPELASITGGSNPPNPNLLPEAYDQALDELAVKIGSFKCD
jgi:hypothetical protein